MSISRRLPVLLMLTLISLSTQPAWAHRFGVILLAPLSGQQAESGKAFIDGFTLATREQDGHAFEESDGHLGGLDSYLYKLDSRLPAEKLDSQLKRLIATEQPTFLTGMPVPDAAQRATAIHGLVQVEPQQSEIWKLAETTPDTLTMTDGTDFSRAFERAYQYAPDAAASRGYIAARLISGTVRSLDQNPAQDIGTTRDALNQALNRAAASVR